MRNFITGYEYSGVNAEILEGVGVSEVCTFKQALSLDGLSGKDLKGIKAVASLMRFKKDDVEEDENGRPKSKPIFFAVFDKEEILSRKVS
tara:strand:+ start:28 stop:297 length:270 start_codon:yes stop_codon:yes gene_type:complete